MLHNLRNNPQKKNRKISNVFQFLKVYRHSSTLKNVPIKPIAYNLGIDPETLTILISVFTGEVVRYGS